MNLQYYRYTCYCGNIFKTLRLIGDPYAEFLLRSEIDELIYFYAANSREFKELSDILDLYFGLRDRKDIDESDVIQDIFSLVCDLSPQKKLYFMNKHPNCTQCLSPYQMEGWIDIYPPEIVDVDIKEITCKEWNELSKVEKIELVEKGFQIAAQRSKEIIAIRRASKPWPTLSTVEKEEATKKRVAIRNKTFKEML
jgi:hypothetical protein